MTITLGPGKFYGSSLPRPRIYTDIKYNTDRVDPPVSVLDPFMSWAEEAHWSTGGLSSNRHRLQGRIEGDIQKIRNHIETSIEKREPLSPEPGSKKAGKSPSSPAVPPAPIANKRKRRFVGLVDEDDDDVSGDGKKWLVRKLSDEFDLVATKKGEIEGEGVAARTRGRSESGGYGDDEEWYEGEEKVEEGGGVKYCGLRCPMKCLNERVYCN